MAGTKGQKKRFWSDEEKLLRHHRRRVQISRKLDLSMLMTSGRRREAMCRHVVVAVSPCRRVTM